MTPLERFELAADAAFGSKPLPHPNLYVSAWYLLAVSEDAQRLLFTNLGEQLDDWRVEYFLDRFKFSLRQCLSAIHQKVTDRTSVALPTKIIPFLYERTHDFLAAGIDYSVAAQICSSAHVGDAEVIENGDKFLVRLNEQILDKRYGALEMMRQSAGQPEIAFSMLLWTWIRHWEYLPMVGHRIAESVRLSKRRVKYEFRPELSQQLAQSIPQPSFFIPDGWTFPWGGRHETTLLLNALCLRVLYHLVAVHFGAGRLALKGGAEADLCLCLSKEELIRDIDMNSSLGPTPIRSFIDYVTYGRRVESPDQALQPLVPLGKDLLGMPGIGLLSSNIERNLLTLQARIEPRLFDSQSSIFEAEMTRRLLLLVEQRWQRTVANKTFQLGNTREELDLLICEPETRTVLMLELRWMLPPADPREVQTKKRTCREKVEQAARKLSAVRANPTALLRVAFDVGVEAAGEWNVFGAVVIQGFGGAVSQHPAIPVVPDWVLESAVCACQSLQQLARWLLSLDWLPVEGRDFATRDTSLELVNVCYPGIIPVRPGREYLRDVTANFGG